MFIADAVRGPARSRTAAKFYLSPEPPDRGPVVEDFSMVVDARLVAGPTAGYGIVFRSIDEDNYYQAEINIYDQQVTLSKLVGGELEAIIDWIDAPSVNTDGGESDRHPRVGDEIRANVNGQEVAARPRRHVLARGGRLRRDDLGRSADAQLRQRAGDDADAPLTSAAGTAKRGGIRPMGGSSDGGQPQRDSTR